MAAVAQYYERASVNQLARLAQILATQILLLIGLLRRRMIRLDVADKTFDYAAGQVALIGLGGERNALGTRLLPRPAKTAHTDCSTS